MNGIPILTVLTVLPVVGAVIALFAGRHARAVAVVTSLAGLALALVVWTQLPADGSMGLVERAAWAPSLGIEYHLGVDALGALMLVLSAIVTLMSVDAAQHVHRQPNLYFCLVLLLQAGLYGSFTALNFFHWFLFWELSLIPAFFLIKLWGGAKCGPAATQFFVYTMAGSVALLISFLAVSGHGKHGLWAVDRDGVNRGPGTCGDHAPGSGDEVAGDWRAGGVCGEGAAHAVPHLAAQCLCRSALAGDDAADGSDVEDGFVRLAADCAADLRT